MQSFQMISIQFLRNDVVLLPYLLLVIDVLCLRTFPPDVVLLLRTLLKYRADCFRMRQA